MAETGIIQKLRRARNLFILRTLPPCKEIVKIVSASLDRKLTFRERTVMRLHLFLGSAASQLDENLKHELFAGRLSDDARDRIKNVLKSSAGLFALLLVAI